MKDPAFWTRHIFPRGVNSAYERGGDARRQFWIKPLKETDQNTLSETKIRNLLP